MSELAAMTEEDRKAFFEDVNKDNASKAAFLSQFVGQCVTVVDKNGNPWREAPNPFEAQKEEK